MQSTLCHEKNGTHGNDEIIHMGAILVETRCTGRDKT